MLKRNKGDILYLSDNKRIRYPSRIYDGESSFITAFSKNNLPSTLGSIGQFINTAVDAYKDNSSVKDMNGQEAIIEQQLNNSFDTSNNTESLLNQFNSTNWLNSDYEGKDLKNATTGQQIGNTISSTLQGASTGATIGGPWGALAGGILGAGASIGGIVVGNKKAKDLAAKLNTQSILGNTSVINKFNNATLSTIDNMYKDLYGNVAAYGGNLNMDIPNYQTHGGDFSNGIIKINEGGTHEENPNGGVLMGVDSQGVPNLVEEGEVIYNDYVFSNRLTPSNDLLKKVKLPKKYEGKSYSYIAEDLSKESEETPNDPISKRGLQANMSKLATLQELQRQSMGKQGTNQLIKGNTAAFGGRIYDGLEDTSKLANKEIDKYRMGLMPVDNSKMKFPGVTYNDTSTIIPKSTKSTTSNTKKSSLPTYLRYAPVLSSGIASLNSLLQKPDYENADILKSLASNVPNNRVRFNKIYNSYNYKPVDSDYLLNQVKAQAGATNSAILNSNANAGTALSALLSSGYNAQKGVGNAIMQAENLNNERRRVAAQMQTAVDQYNSQGLANADSQNANLALQQANMRNTLLSNYASMRENIDNALEQSRSLNLTNFTDNLSNIGRENVNWNYLQNLIDSDYFNVLNKNMRYNKEGKVIAKYSDKIKRKK